MSTTDGMPLAVLEEAALRHRVSVRYLYLLRERGALTFHKRPGDRRSYVNLDELDRHFVTTTPIARPHP